MYYFLFAAPPYERIRAAYESPNNAPWTVGYELDPETVYVEVYEGLEYQGCFSFSRTDDPETVGIHTTLLPIAYGHAVEIGLELVRWLGQTTPFRTLRTLGSYRNPLIIRLLREVGFREICLHDKTIRVNGSEHQLHVFELSIPREEAYVKSE